MSTYAQKEVYFNNTANEDINHDNGYTNQPTCVRYGYKSNGYSGWVSWKEGYYGTLI